MFKGKKVKKGKFVTVLNKVPHHDDVLRNGCIAPRILTSALDGGMEVSS
jgi:hypothetical protein